MRLFDLFDPCTQRCLTLQVSVHVFQGPQPTQLTDVGHSLPHFWTVAEFHRWACGKRTPQLSLALPAFASHASLLQDISLLKWTYQ